MKLYGSLERLVSIIFRKNSEDITFRPNQATTYTAARDFQLPPGDSDQVLMSATSTQTVTNKTMSGASNTFSNISLTTSVTGILPGANGGTGVSSTATFPTSGVVVTEAGTETLTNKTISGASNTITNVSLTAGVTGVLPIANGGTNSSAALSNNRILKSLGGAIVEAAAITANKALASDANGIPVASATSDTELGYVSGVTSAIQTQLNGKASTALNNLTVAGLTADDLLYASSSSAVTRLAIGTTGQVLTVAGGAPTWATPASSTTSFKAHWLTADGASKTIVHSLGSTDVMVQIFDEDNGTTIEVDAVVRTDANTLDLTSSEAPATSWRVLILKM